MKTRLIALFAMLLLAITGAGAQTTEADVILGVWETGSGKARVKIDKVGEKYFGKIVWLREPNNEEGKPKVDKNNPDEKMRTTPLLGYRMLKDFNYSGEKNLGRRNDLRSGEWQHL